MTDDKSKTCIFRKCGRETWKKDQLCIFHSQDIEGKKEEFKEAFWKDYERQKASDEDYNFKGFRFPDNISFREIEFEKGAYFSDARFSADADFSDAQFCAEANFFATRFSAGAGFNFARFTDEASFVNAQFSNNADFRGARFFESADFRRAHFTSEVYFINARFTADANFFDARFFDDTNFFYAQFSSGADFSDAQFSGEAGFNYSQFFAEADFERAEFSKYASFENIKLEKINGFKMLDTYILDVTGLFESVEDNKQKFKYSNKQEFLPDNFKLILGEKATARYPVISRKIKDDMYLLDFQEKHPKLFKIWWLFADCGRSITRWALWSILFAVMFAFIFHNIFYLQEPTIFKAEHVNEVWSGFSFIYYSVVTFTTLGFGDIVPKNGWLQFLVMAEVILGYVMLGGLISILANKLARRS